MSGLSGGLDAEELAESLQGRFRGGRQVPVAPQRLGDLVAGALEQGQGELALAHAPPGVVGVDVVGEREGRGWGFGDGPADPVRGLWAHPRGQPQCHHRLGIAACAGGWVGGR